MPRVSVITPMHNAAGGIARAIRSVQDQSMCDYEHIVIDNMSSDDSAKVAKQLAADDARIRVLSNTACQGAGATRNVGIKEATGRYIAFLDADDAWHPEKLSAQIDQMERDGRAFSWTSYRIVSSDGEILRTQLADTCISYRDLLLKRTVIGCLTAVYDSDLVGKRFMSNIPMRQDFCLWLEIIRACDEAGLPYGGLRDVLASYTIGGMTANKKKAALAQWRALRGHLKLPLPQAVAAFASYAFQGVKDRAAR